MDAFGNLFAAFGTVLQPEYLLYALIGAAIGMAVGVLPGLGPSVTMALLLPVVFALGDPTGAIIMFAGIFYGAMYGGATTSILLSTPGESSSVVTVLDGYRMTLSGRAGAALLAAAMGSFVAGILATFGLALVAEPLARVALTFGPAEYFAFAVLALATTSMLGGRPLKAAFSALLGLAIGTIGIHAVSGTNRFTYGVLAIYNGIDFELVTIGIFAVVEVLFVLGAVRRSGKSRGRALVGKLLMTAQEWRRCVGPWLRGATLGFAVGSLPGAGATVASYLSYGVERNISKTPEMFGRGKGMIEGLAGPEAANNAAAGGSLVPLLALGIPGSAATAVMLGALQGFGVKTGPLLLRDNPDFVWAVIASMLVGNLMLIVLNIPLIGLWVRLLSVPTALLYPMILVVSTVGVFSLARNATDLKLMIIFAMVGLVLRICDFPLAPAVLGLVLGPLMEEQWGRGLTASRGDWTIFVGSPTSRVIMLLALAVATLPLTQRAVRTVRARQHSRVEA
ncbi:MULTISPECIES: tripartite tricarboxylate transporter permease [unclassified Micromonospora]|uniref:tripartite tricarboxylate transporter permease n=1 Tax=unclassified Micromonospora TaxID=2617518 RepID=UPI003A85CDCE